MDVWEEILKWRGALTKQSLTIPDNDVNRLCAESTAIVNGSKLG